MAIKHVGVNEAYELNTRESYTYVDVRSMPEYEQAHAAGAVNVPLLHRDPRTGEMVPNPDFLAVIKANFPTDAKLLVACQAGGRSLRAAQLLDAHGYQNIVNVKGGFGGAMDPRTGAVVERGWRDAQLPVETTAASGASYADLLAKAKQAR